jgi:hypothetical protein
LRVLTLTVNSVTVNKMNKPIFRQWLGDRYHRWGFISGGFVAPASLTTAHSVTAYHNSEHEQFTGEPDHEGVELCEGDIVHETNRKYLTADNIKYIIGVVIYEGGAFKIHYTGVKTGRDYGKYLIGDRRPYWPVCIGTLKQNPELLKTGV